MYSKLQPSLGQVLAIADRQHNLVTYARLRRLGLSPRAIRHRVDTGRLHPKRVGVFAVGNPALTLKGEWMAAVLACGEGARLSYHSAAMLWEIRAALRGPIHVSVPPGRKPKQPGVIVHRRRAIEVDEVDNIPVTGIVQTIVDIARDLAAKELERVIGEADRLDLIDPESLRAGLDAYAGQPGVVPLRRTLDKHVFVLTHTELERLFLPLATRAGLPLPTGQKRLPKGRVDFYWSELNLVVECDGLRYHRTPAQQSSDLYRDHANAAAGNLTLRFSHHQIKYDPSHVEETLRAVARTLSGGAPRSHGRSASRRSSVSRRA